MKDIFSIRLFRKMLALAAGFLLYPQTLLSQTSSAENHSTQAPQTSPAQTPDTTAQLIEKAHTLELSGHLDTAAQIWQQILLAEPNNTEALAGLAHSARLSGNSALAKVYLDRLRAIHPNDPNLIPDENTGARAIKANPRSVAAWRDLFMAQSQAGKSAEALNTERHFPAGVRSQLMHDPEFISALASAHSATGSDLDAQRILRSALELPFLPEAQNIQAQIQVQYAMLLLQANHLDQAAGLFNQVLATDLTNTAAWQGHIRILHALNEDPQALQSLQAMPPATYEIAMRDSDFQLTVASIYRNQNKLDIAQDLLEKFVARQQAKGEKPSTPVMLELACIYVERNDARHAIPIYRAILTDDPDHPDAWKGLLTVLRTSGSDQLALEQSQQIPQAIRHKLENDPEYLQTLATLYGDLSQPREAIVYAQRAQQQYSAQHMVPPADLDVKTASLYFNAGDDTGLYRQLIHVGKRADLDDGQHQFVQGVWAKWAVRRANQAATAGNLKRSFAILDAASRAFPENPGVQRALASQYASAGLPKNSLAIFKLQNMTAATVSDYHAAIGSALAAGDLKTAQTWLRDALDMYPKDAEILHLAAKFEEARGNSNRAVDYYRASLAALPPNDPSIELLAELNQYHDVTGLPIAHPQNLVTLLGTPDTPTSGNDLVASAGPAKPGSQNQIHTDNKATSQSTTKIGNDDQSTDNIVESSYSVPPSVTASDPAKPDSNAPITSRPMSSQPPKQPQEVYGPYVPYIPPAPAHAFTPSPVSVQLGDSTPKNLPPQPEVVDVLPKASYLPNAQNVLTARTIDHPVFSTTPPQGQSDTPSTQNVLYSPQTQYPQSSGIIYGQQYPQPDGTVTVKTPHRRSLQSKANVRSTRGRSSSASTGNSAPARPAVDFGTTIINNTTAPPDHLGETPKGNGGETDGASPALGIHDPNVPEGQPPVFHRADTERELNALEASFSDWLGGTGYARYRSGTSGLDRLNDYESPFEASAVFHKTVRATIIARPVFLSNGFLDTTTFQNSTNTIPVLGTFPANALVSPTPQYASGVAGEFQLASTNYAAAVGYTPYQFLIGNVLARGQWRTVKGHLTFFGERDSVKDTQLSYAGMRDPGSATLSSDGNIWGGVVSTGGGVRLDINGTKSGLTVSGSAADLSGVHVLRNLRYDGQMSAYFTVHRWPGHGSLNLGGLLYGMHYDHNEQAMTYGQGGYFSPNIYFLAAVPVTYNGYYKSLLHYSVSGAVGVKTFQQARAPYFPLDVPLETDFGNPFTPASSYTGLNYSFNSEASYHFNEHWFVGAFLTANNTYNYNNFTGGFFIRYLFKAQTPTEESPTGLFPLSGTRALRVP